MGLFSIFKPTSLVERADRQMQHAKVLFRDYQSAMRRDDRAVAKDLMLW